VVTLAASRLTRREGLRPSHLDVAAFLIAPVDRHADRDVEFSARRHEVYERAYARHPARWTGATRNESPIETVTLSTRVGSRGASAKNTPLLDRYSYTQPRTGIAYIDLSVANEGGLIAA